MLRRLLLRAADSSRVGRVVRRHGMRLGASRWVAGQTLTEVDGVLRRLNAQGLGAATALFDASVTNQAQAEDLVREYQAAVHQLSNAGLDAYVGIKLSHLGLGFGNPEAAFRNTAAIITDAATSGQFVRIEMEQSRYVDHTLGVYRRLRDTGHENCGVVLQSYLRRSESDLQELLDLAPNVRLVKGAYLESPNVAYPDKRDTDAAYARLLETALRGTGFVAIATHDDRLIAHATRLVSDLQVPHHRFAFEMLYGVRERTQQELAQRGYRVVVAAPYGPDWFPYLMRRLAERPANLAFFLRNIGRD